MGYSPEDIAAGALNGRVVNNPAAPVPVQQAAVAPVAQGTIPPPAFSTPTFPTPSTYQVGTPPANQFAYNLPQAPAPMTMGDLMGIFGQLPQNQIQQPNLPNYQNTVPMPQYQAPPQSQSYMAMLQQYGILPTPGTAAYQQAMAPVQFQGVSVNLPSFTPPTYHNSQSIMDRVNNASQLKYGAQEDQLNWNMDELLRDLNMNVDAQTGYGQLGDQKLAEIFQNLQGSLGQMGTRIGNLYDQGQQKVAGYYDQAQQAFGEQSGNVQDTLAGLASQFNLGDGLTDASKWLSGTIADTGAGIASDRANSLGNLATLGTNMQVGNVQDQANAMVLGANKRADLQNLVQGNIGALRLQYGKDKADQMQQLLSLTKEKGAFAKDYFSQLEDQDYERNYRAAVDAANIGMKGAEIGAQVAGINANLQVDAAKLTFQKQQALVDSLKDAYQFAENNKWMEYQSKQDYDKSVMEYFNNAYAANMQGVQIGLDVNKFNAQMGQQNIQNTLQFGNFFANQNQQQFANRMDLNNFALNANAQNFSQWATQQQLGQSANNAQWNNWGLQNQVTQGNQANAMNYWSTINNAQQQQNQTAFNQWLATQNLNLDWTKFNADQNPNSFSNRLAMYQAKNQVAQAAQQLSISGRTADANILLGILGAANDFQALQANLSKLPDELQQIISSTNVNNANANYTNGIINGTISTGTSSSTNPYLPKTAVQKTNELLAQNGITTQSNPKFMDEFNRLAQVINTQRMSQNPLNTSNPSISDVVMSEWMNAMQNPNSNLTKYGLNSTLMLAALQSYFGQG